jgi:uncharacterized coiled-coil DUF342 family protein
MKNFLRFCIAQLSFFFKNKKINKKQEIKVIKQIEYFYKQKKKLKSQLKKVNKIYMILQKMKEIKLEMN